MGNGSTTNVQGVTVQAEPAEGLGGLANGIGFSPGIGGDASASASTGTSTGAANIITEAYGGASPAGSPTVSAVARSQGTGTSGSASAKAYSGGGATCEPIRRWPLGYSPARAQAKAARPPASCFQVLVLPMDCKLPPT